MVDNNNNKNKDKIKIASKLYEGKYVNETLYDSFEANINYIKNYLGKTYDLLSHQFILKSETKEVKVAMFYVNGMVKQSYIHETIIEGINNNFDRLYKIGKKKIKFNEENFKKYILTFIEQDVDNKFGKLFHMLLSGETILLVDGFKEFFIFGTRQYNERPVSTPTTNMNVVGPKDSFNENIQTNVTLIRRRIKNPALWTERFILGEKTNTDVVIMYLKDLVDPPLVNSVRERLHSAKLTSVIDSSYVHNAIKNKNFCIFPTIYQSERPDVISANILEGRVAIIVDGSPFVMVVPTIFNQFFHSVTDYYNKAYVATFFRLLRTGGFYVALLLPAIYVMLTSMHSELVPFELLVAISGQRQGIPFPAVIEATLLCLIYDVLREAGARMPVALGSAISIVGALVLGDAAVQASIVSPIMIMVVAGSAITTLIIPDYNLQLKTSILKYPFIIISAMFGLLGITLGLVLLHLHLASIRTFGVSYLAPFGPFNFKGLSDTLIKMPMKNTKNENTSFNDKYPY